VSFEKVSFPANSSSRRPRWILPIAGVALALLLTGAFGYRYWISTPQYSLWQAKSAFEAHDLGAFERYVAVDSCMDSLTDDVFAEATKKMNAQAQSGPNPFGEAGQKMAQGFLALMKPAISGALKKSARELVATGQIASVGGAGGGSPVNLAQIKDNIAQNGVRFDGLGQVSVESQKATVELRFRNDKTASQQPIELEMRRVEDHWQISKWKNAAPWLEEAAKKTP